MHTHTHSCVYYMYVWDIRKDMLKILCIVYICIYVYVQKHII